MSLFQNNFHRFQEKLREKELKWAFLVPGPNFFYLTGIEMDPLERLTAAIIPSDNSPTIICPAFEEPRLRKATWINNFISWEEHENPFLKVSEAINDFPKENTGIDGAVDLEKCLELKRCGVDLASVHSVSPLFRDLRIRKTEQELDIMRKAGEIVCNGVQTGAFQSMF
jgi:Xaa-Pro dipeptidase